MKHKLLIFYILICCTSIYSFGQSNLLYKKMLLIAGADTLPYRLLLPKNFNPKTKYPLLIFLHGAGERGNDNQAQLTHGAPLFLVDSVRENYPAIVVFPQCPKGGYWSNVQFITDSVSKKRTHQFLSDGEPTVAMRLLQKMVRALQKEYRLKKSKMYAAGLSMGGMGTFELVRRMPKVFAAAISICGGASAATAPQIATTHWWIFHGENDDVVQPIHSKMMAEALRQNGADVKLTLYPNANHNSWDSAFAEKDFLSWLFSKNR